MASDGDVMEGCIPATPDKERELWEKEIVKILQDTENGFGMSEVEAEAVISDETDEDYGGVSVSENGIPL